VQRVGKDTRATQTLLRHANLKSSQIYTLVSDQHLQEIVRRLAV
jgi:site-specific recombinase XerD